MPLKLFGAKKTIRHIIGIAAGKGGVGKSALTANLALALNALGYKVGILDADLYGPSIPTMLPLDQRPSQRGDQLMPALSDGISIMSMDFFKPKQQASVIRAPIASKLIAQFVNQVEWGDLDYLLIDFPPGTGDIQISLSQQASLSAALIVTTPQEIALIDVRKCIDMFAQVQIPLAGIVENMSYYQPQENGEKVYLFGKGGGETLARDSGIPFLGQIPVDPIIGECLDTGKSLFRQPNACRMQEVFIRLAKELTIQTQIIEAESKFALRNFTLNWTEITKPFASQALKTSDPDRNQAVITSIDQKDNTKFTLSWTNGRVALYTLAKLQGKCPCAGCAATTPKVDEAVRAHKIQSIGRYAIKIDFTSGCSRGIYDFDLLYKEATL